MKKEIQPHQVRVISEYFSLDKKFRDLQKFVEENPLFAKLPFEESNLLHMQLSAMSSYRAVLTSRLALWGIKPSEEPLWGPDLGRKPHHDPVAFYKAYKASPECKAADAHMGEIARDLGCTSKDATKAYLDTPFAKRVMELEREDWRDRDKRAAESLLRDKAAAGHKDAIIRRAKELRVAIDSVLQDVKAFGKDCLASPCIDTPKPSRSLGAPTKPEVEGFADPQEVPANVKLCQRHLEDATMRLGMTLKAIGATNPYPESYNPDSNRIEPTADAAPIKLNWSKDAPC